MVNKKRDIASYDRNLVHPDGKYSKEIKDFYNSTVWRKTSKKVYEMYYYQCDACMNGYVDPDGNVLIEPKGIITDVIPGKRQGVVHHIIPLQLPISTKSNLDVNNLVLLCHKCHNTIHNKAENLTKYNKINKKEELLLYLEDTDIAFI